MKYFLMCFVLLLNSCMNDTKNSNAQMVNSEEVIDLFADEDGDGIFNTEELNYSLDRTQFDVPRLSFENIVISYLANEEVTAKTEKSKNPQSLFPVLIDQTSPVQYQILTQLNLIERYNFEKHFKNGDEVELAVSGKLNWSLRKIFEVNSIRAHLGIYHYHNSKVTVLSAPIVWRSAPEGHFYEVTRLKSDLAKDFHLFSLPWDFVLIIEDLDWQAQSKKFSWSNISKGLYKLQINHDEHFQQMFFNRKEDFNIYTNKYQNDLIEVASQDYIKHFSNRALLSFWQNNQKIINSIGTFDSYQLVPISKNKKRWNRIDIKLINHRLEKIITVQDVITSWTGQRPCRGPSERKSIRICEGQTINLTCQGAYESYREVSERKKLKSSKLMVETAAGVYSIDEWVKLSGAEYLEGGELIRWEGLQLPDDQFVPIYIQNRDQAKALEYGYLRSECSNAPEHAVRVNHFDMSRKNTKEKTTLELNVSEF